jgi:putative hydrolase
MAGGQPGTTTEGTIVSDQQPPPPADDGREPDDQRPSGDDGPQQPADGRGAGETPREPSRPLEPSRPEDPGAGDPFAALFGGQLPPELQETLRSMGLDAMDPGMLQMIQSQVQALMAEDDGSAMNQSLATDTARRIVAEGGDRTVGAATVRDVEQVVHVANLWLDQVTDLNPPEGGSRALSRAEWVEETMPVWRRVTEPVAAGVGAAITSTMQDQLRQLGEEGPEGGLPQIPGLPPGMNPAEMLGQVQPMMRRMSSAMFGAQVGQAVGALAGETVSGTEVGLPLVPGEVVTILPSNVAAFAEGLSVDPGQVHLYLAVREAARVRLFAGVPWLGPQLLTAVEDYARDISINTDGIEEALRSANPQDPQAMQEALADQLFTPEPSAAQQAALGRLETYLALVEGWVDLVCERAVAGHLPQAGALAEAVRRRRATGGPAEKLFSSLVGLELRPRRLRDAANLWAALESAHGQAERDRAWAHPDVAPDGADLDDPLGFVERFGRGQDTSGSDDLDAELDRLLRGEGGGTGDDRS